MPQSVEDRKRAEKITDLFDQAESAAGEKTQGMLEDDDFYHGAQWDEADLAALREAGAPALTFNMIKPKVRFLNGFLQTNRFDVTVHDAAGNDDATSSIYSKAIKSQLAAEIFEIEFTQLVPDSIIRGKKGAWLYCLPDVNDDLSPKISFERINPLRVFPDPKHESLTLQDADRVHVVTLKTLNEIRDEYDVDDADIRNLMAYAGGDEGEKYRLVSAQYTENDVAGYTPEATTPALPYGGEYDATHEFKTVDTWYREPVEYWILIDREGNTHRTFDPIEAESLLSTGQALDVVVRDKRIVSQIVTVGNVILDEKRDPFHDDIFPLLRFAFAFDSGRCDGLIGEMRDPQQWWNKLVSKFIHAVNAHPQMTVFYEENSLVDAEEHRDKGSFPGYRAPYKFGRPAPTIAPPMQPAIALVQIIQTIEELFSTLSGINVSMQGFAASSDESGKAAALRMSSGMSMIWEYLQNVRIFRLQLGRLMISYFREFFEPQDLLKMTGDERALQIPPLDLAHGEYKLVVDELPSGPTAQIIEYYALAELATQGVPIPPMSLLKRAPIHDKEEIMADFQAMVEAQSKANQGG